jgi:DNA-binding Xre family transcriptional regulator
MTTRKPTLPAGLSKTIPSHAWKDHPLYRKRDRGWLKKSVSVALRIMDVLAERKMSQNDLAEKLKVTRQQVSKILKGQENLTLETISKIEDVLGVELVKIIE